MAGQLLCQSVLSMGEPVVACRGRPEPFSPWQTTRVQHSLDEKAQDRAASSWNKTGGDWQSIRMCRNFWVGRWKALLGGRLGGEGIELLGWREALFGPFFPLVFPQHRDELNPGEGTLRSLK
jgi:hypothetical protein